MVGKAQNEQLTDHALVCAVWEFEKDCDGLEGGVSTLLGEQD